MGVGDRQLAKKNDEWCRSWRGSLDYSSEGENAMQYLLMYCFDETRWAQLPDARSGQIMQEYRAFIQGIVMSGHCRASLKPYPSSMATTVREQHGKLLTTEGPFAETDPTTWTRALDAQAVGDEGDARLPNLHRRRAR
jgi:hypothetical protein